MKITLKNMVFYGYHGLHEHERTLGQRFSVDITATTDPGLDAHVKRLGDTVDYTAIFDVVKNEVENYKYHLLEKLANKILDHILNQFSLVKKCQIKIRKIAVPITGTLDYVELEMERER
ncbi:MAG: dihydroneopterin aldolase [Candidatus Cloacimonetes bacterium]|nr:dihydroneopterin aldolase [Candidatus Cloacimonadota bacterium]MBL7085754.1 dihydroneopterin aldolase [Candidatus Cloacimonadota bacterium]